MALIVRVEHWEANNSGNLTVEQLTKFEQDLNILKELSDRSPIVMHKVRDNRFLSSFSRSLTKGLII